MDDRLEVRPYALPDAFLEEYGRPFAWTVFAPRERCVVLGKSNSAAGEIFEDRVLADGLAVYRRPSGGHTVLLTPRTAVAAFHTAGRPGLVPEKFFRTYTRILIGALERLGVRDVARRGTSDLALGEMKIAGSSLYLGSRSALFHAVVNLAEDPETIARYLRMPPREPDYRRGRPHAGFVTSLVREGHRLEARDLERAVREELQSAEKPYPAS